MVEIRRLPVIEIGTDPVALDAQRLARERWTLRQAYPNELEYANARRIRFRAPQLLGLSIEWHRTSISTGYVTKGAAGLIVAAVAALIAATQ